jgi:hypothetical protein
MMEGGTREGGNWSEGKSLDGEQENERKKASAEARPKPVSGFLITLHRCLRCSSSFVHTVGLLNSRSNANNYINLKKLFFAYRNESSTFLHAKS